MIARSPTGSARSSTTCSSPASSTRTSSRHDRAAATRAARESVVETARTHLPEAIDARAATRGRDPARGRRPGPAAPGARQPRRQRDQVLARGRPRELSIGDGDGAIRFSVADQGLGIPASEHRRIFEKFYRLDPDMTRGIGGTGLGLYICRELVRRMDGRIWVESKPARARRSSSSCRRRRSGAAG